MNKVTITITEKYLEENTLSEGKLTGTAVGTAAGVGGYFSVTGTMTPYSFAALVGVPVSFAGPVLVAISLGGAIFTGIATHKIQEALRKKYYSYITGCSKFKHEDKSKAMECVIKGYEKIKSGLKSDMKSVCEKAASPKEKYKCEKGFAKSIARAEKVLVKSRKYLAQYRKKHANQGRYKKDEE